jgi:hypothetical protein
MLEYALCASVKQPTMSDINQRRFRGGILARFAYFFVLRVLHGVPGKIVAF